MCLFQLLRMLQMEVSSVVDMLGRKDFGRRPTRLLRPRTGGLERAVRFGLPRIPRPTSADKSLPRLFFWLHAFGPGVRDLGVGPKNYCNINLVLLYHYSSIVMTIYYSIAATIDSIVLGSTTPRSRFFGQST